MASSSTVDKPRPPKPPIGGEWIEYDQFIDRQIRKTRGQVKGVEIASALMTLAAGALAFFLVAAVVDHWVLVHGLGFWGRLLCLAMFLGGAGYYAAEKLLPWLIFRINPIYAAQAIEKSRPTLKNSLINFLFLRSQTAHVPKAIYEAVEQQAATGLSRVTVESAVDRSRLIHIGYALLTIVGLFAAYFLFSPKSPWDTIGRVIMPWANIQVPTRVEILDVQPGLGMRTVFRGETVDVSAEIRGLNGDEPVRVVYSTADHEAVDQPVTMYLPAERFRHSAKIPPGEAGVQQDIDYRIEAGDAVSPTYHLTAVTAPTIAVDSVDYQFPDYTGRARITLKGIGDIQSLEGTRVVIHGRANESIKSAQLELIGREHPTKLAMHVGDDGKSVTGSFTLAFDEQDRTAPQFSHYRLRPEGRGEPEPVRYRIDVIPDLAPEVKFIAPEKDEVALPVNSRLKLKLRALDPDFALSQLTLSAESNRTSVFEKQLLNEIRREPMQVEFTVDPAKLHLKDGDLVEYWATAKDNRQPTPNATQTARRRIRIVAADARQGDSNATEGDGQGAGNPADKSDKPNDSGKPNDDKQQPNDAQKQGQPPADKAADDKSPGAKSPKQQQGDRQDGAENKPENQPQDAAHDQKQDKPSPDQQQPKQDGGTKPQDPSSKQKQDNNQNASDKQDSDKNQGANNQKPDDKQKGGGSKSEKNGGQSSQKSDSGKGGSDNKSGGDKSGSDKSGADKSSGDKSGSDKSGSNDSQQDNAGGQQKNADQNANPQGQRDERPASDGSDDAAALKQILKHQQDAAKNGSQGKPSDQSQNSDGQKQPRGEKQPGGKQSDSPNQPDSQSKPGDGQKPDGAKPQPNSQQKPSDGQKSGDKSAGDKSQGGSKSAADKPNGDQQSTKEGDAQSTGAKKNSSEQSAGDKSKGANSTKEDAPTKPSGDKVDGSKSGDKSDKPGTEQNRDSTPGKNKSGNSEKPDQGNGDRTKDGSQPTGDKHQPQDDKEQSQTKAGDPDSDKGESGAGTDTAKDDKATPPSPSDTNQPSKNKKDQPKSAGKKESQGKDEGKSPTTSPKESNSQGDQDGDRSGGGQKGGGQGANQAGTGGSGKNTAADQGNGVAQGHGDGEDSSKAGADKASSNRTGKSGDKEGPGSHTKAADSDHPNNPVPSQSQDDAGKPSAQSAQGSAGKNADEPSGPGSSGYEPRGGGNDSGAPPTAPPPGTETTGNAANPEFAKKQFDMALESLKKGKPDLLKELNWTPEEAQKLAERLERMRRNAEVPGAKGDDARRQMDDLLHSLGARGGQVDRRSGGNAIDTQRGLHESHDAGPPPEYSEQVEAFQKGILQGGK